MSRRKKSVIPGFSLNRALGITSAKQKFARATGIPTTKQGRKRKMQKSLWTAVAIGTAAALSSSGAKTSGTSKPRASGGSSSGVLAFFFGVVLLVCGINLFLIMLDSFYPILLIGGSAAIIGGAYLCTNGVLAMIDCIKRIVRFFRGDSSSEVSRDAPAPPPVAGHDVDAPR